MKALVIFNSQTGFTKRYAEWIAEDLNADLTSLKEAKQIKLSSYDTIIFGSWCMAGSLVGLNWFKKKLSSLTDKKLAIFACGASPKENPEVDTFLSERFTEDVFRETRVFYCPGGLNYNRMKMVSWLAMKLFSQILKNKKNKTSEEEIQANMISHNYDISERKYANEVVQWVKS